LKGEPLDLVKVVLLLDPPPIQLTTNYWRDSITKQKKSQKRQHCYGVVKVFITYALCNF